MHDNTNPQYEYVCCSNGKIIYGYYVDASGAVKNISYTVSDTILKNSEYTSKCTAYRGRDGKEYIVCGVFGLDTATGDNGILPGLNIGATYI